MSILRVLITCVEIFVFGMGLSISAVYAQEQWPVLEGVDGWPEITSDAETMEVSGMAEPEGRQRVSMRLNGWWFRKTGNDGAWEQIMVPDTWRQAGAPHHRWYARRFTIPQVFSEKRLFIEFGAVRLYAEVFLNGRRVGSHAGGFTPFRLDVTESARVGSVNTLVVYVKDDTYAKHGAGLYHQVGVTDMIRGSEDSAEGGIWQDVYLKSVPPVHVSDIYVRTSTRRQLLEATITVRNDGPVESRIQLMPSLHEWPDGAPAKLQLSVLNGSVPPGGSRTFEVWQTWSDPKLWSPENPNLYWLQTALIANSVADTQQDSSRVRFGFREFWIDGPDFYLNGVRTRLRGDSDPAKSAREPFMWRKDFVRRLMQIMKQEIGLNAFRIVATLAPPTIFNAADEVGILLINQSSFWSLGKRWYRNGGDRLMENTRREYEEWIKRDRNHPSVVLWDAENEMLRNDMEDWEWASRLTDFIRPWDNTRPIIHSGSGATHPSMPVYHIHHHENYSALYAAYNRRRDKPLLAGEYWVGGRSGERRLTTGEEFFSYDDYLRRSALLWKERMDEQRVNGLAGIMPYYWMNGWGSRLLCPLPDVPLDWPDPTAPGIKPAEPPWFFHPREWNLPGPEYVLFPEVADAFRSGLSPLHVAFRENSGNYYSEEALRKTIVVSNDLETGRDLTLRWQLHDSDHIVQKGESRQRIKAGDQWVFSLNLPMPQTQHSRHLRLHTEVRSDGGHSSSDDLTVSLYPEYTRSLPTLSQDIGIFDPAGSLEPVVKQAQGRVQIIPDLLTSTLPDILLIGESVEPAVLKNAGQRLIAHIRNGGRMLLLQQETAPDWFDAGLDMHQVPPVQTHNEFRHFEFDGEEKAVYQSRYGVVHSPAHPVMRGIPDAMLRWWRFGDGRIADDILVRPQAREQITTPNMRSILGGTRREYSSLLEVMYGSGVMLYSQLELLDNYQIDPAATLLLHNLMTYLQDWQPLQPAANILGIGLENTGILENWVTSVDQFPDVFLDYRAMIIGSDVQPSTQQLERVDDFVRAGGIVFYTPGGILPPHLAERVEIVEPDTIPSILHIRRYSAVISGFNSFECEYWTVPPVHKVMRMQQEPQVGGLLQAGAVAHTNWGRGKQLDHQNYRSLGLALVEFPAGQGSYIISQLSLPEADNYQARAVYAAIFTNLGIKLPE
jgi:hypothetical protein